MPTKICAYGMDGLITPMVKIFAAEEPVLAALTAASVRGLIATGARSGQRLRRTAIRALRPAPIAWGGRPCWRGCFPPTSAHA